MIELNSLLIGFTTGIIKYVAFKQFGEGLNNLLLSGLADFAGDNLNEKIRSFICTKKNAEEILNAFQYADQKFCKIVGDQQLKEAIISKPLAGLGSLSNLAKKLPEIITDEALRVAIKKQLQEDWRITLSSQQIDHAVLTYMICLDEALVLKANQLLPAIFRTVKRIELNSEEILAGLEILQSDIQGFRESQEKQISVSNGIFGLLEQQIVNPNPIEFEKALSSEYEKEIDFGKTQLDNLRPNQSIEYLINLRKRIWENASKIDKYRILTIIGSSLLLINRNTEAAELLIEALTLNPKNSKALSNAAYGYFLQGNIEKSTELVRKAIEIDPTNFNAYPILAYTLSDTCEFENIEQVIPDFYHKKPEIALSLGSIAYRKGLNIEAERWLRVSVDNNKSNNPDAFGLLADVLLDSVIKNNPPMSIKEISTPYSEKLTEALGLYTLAWDRVKDTELRFIRASWLANRTIAYALLGNTELANKDIEQALFLKPDFPQFLRINGMLAFQEKHYKKAEKLFKKILSQSDLPDITFWLAATLFSENNFNGAKDLLRIITSEGSQDFSEELKFEAHKLLLMVFLQEGNFISASSESMMIETIYNSHPDALALCARFSRLSNNIEKSKLMLEKAKGLITNLTSIPERIFVINELLEHKDYRSAKELIEVFINRTIDSYLNRQFLFCLYKEKEYESALEICRELKKNYGPLDYATKIEISILEEITDYESAKAACKEYLDKYPENLSFQIQLAIINFHNHDFEEVDNFLKEPIALTGLMFEEYEYLAELNLLRGFYENAINISYEAKRIFSNNPEAYLLYVKIFLSRDSDNYDWLNHTSVQLNSVVNLKYQNSIEELILIIDDKDDASLSRNEILPDHPIALAILGKHIEEIIEIPDGMGTRLCSIENIRSKYVYAFQETLQKYPAMFSKTQGISRIQITLPDQQNNDGTWLRPILDVIDKQNNIITMVEGHYKTGNLPIGAMANLLRKNPIEVEAGLASTPDPGVICYLGDNNNMLSSIKDLEKRPILVIDILSLKLIHELNIHEQIYDHFGSPIIARNSISVIESLLYDPAILRKKEYFSIGKVDGKYVRNDFSEESIEHNANFIKQLISWAETKCIISSIQPVTEFLEAREVLGHKIGLSFIDSVILSQQKGALLYSDDYALRNLAASEYKLNCIWTQPLLLYLRNQGILSQEEYASKLIYLICLNFRFISIDAFVLMEAAKKAKYLPKHPYLETVRNLRGDYSDLNSSIFVASSFVRMLWKEKLPIHNYEELFYELLKNIVSLRNNKIQVINQFYKILVEVFKLAPTEIEHLQRMIVDWQSIHLI